MPIQLQYAQVEQALMGLNRISEEKRGAFRARLRHLKQMGFPEGTNTGKGQRAVYDIMAYFKMVFATELMQAGVSPSRIVRILRGNWDNMEFDILVALTPPDFLAGFKPQITEDDADFAWILSLEALRDLTIEGEREFDYHETIDTTPISKLSETLVSDGWGNIGVGDMWRTLVIQGRFLINIAIHELHKVEPEISVGNVYFAVLEILQEKGRRLEELGRLIDISIAKSKDDDQHPQT